MGFTRGNPGVQLFPRGKSAFTFAWFSPGVSLVSPWGNPGVTKKSVPSGFPRFPLGFLLVFPRGIPVFPWGKPRGRPGENQPERKSKVGACLFGIAIAGFPLGVPRGKPAFLPFPWGFAGFPLGKASFPEFRKSRILDFGLAGILVGLTTPGFPRGKHRGFTRGKSVWMSPWFSPGEKRRRRFSPGQVQCLVPETTSAIWKTYLK